MIWSILEIRNADHLCRQELQGRAAVLAILKLLNLLLPALFPSWRFFDVIGPSPRVELCLLDNPEDDAAVWQECRPRPAQLGLRGRVAGFFWNARWNETLYLTNCAERFIQGQEEHASREIRRRLRGDLLRDGGEEGDGAVPAFFRFRLVFVSRDEGDSLRRDVAFVSPPYQTVDPLDR